ncbi:response regulator [Pontiella sp.]|uniref:response regulator n=1 Tax=Pontiella sp. TaxID=2837462 RepID=UPI003567B6BF
MTSIAEQIRPKGNRPSDAATVAASEAAAEAATEAAAEAAAAPSDAQPPADATSLTGTFLSATSHDIRNALNGIVGMAQLISDTHLTVEQRNCLETILQSTTGLLKTVNYALDISKIEAGQMELSETSSDLSAVSNRLQRAFRPLAQQKGVELKCVCTDNVPLSVMCDEAMIERVLGNLLHNALERTAAGSVALHIECTNKSPQGAELSFKVMDTGVGLNQTLLEALKEAPNGNKMDSFRRLSQTAGMDLAISKQLIELMDGTFDVICPKNEGSIFSINLTLCQANRPAPILLAGGPRITTIASETRVLLAEDNKLNQKATESILRKAGCHVEVVDNGNTAVQRVRERNYDLILMDCQMPVMDGFEATALIRAAEDGSRRVPIIALTANALKGDRQKCLDSGMDGYLPKPVGRQDLIDTINKFALKKEEPVAAEPDVPEEAESTLVWEPAT